MATPKPSPYAVGGEVADPRPTHLSEQQLARVEALQKVNTYVRSVKVFGGEAADPFALMRLAYFVLHGEDMLDTASEDD